MRSKLLVKVAFFSLFVLTGFLFVGFQSKTVSAGAIWCYLLVPANKYSSPAQPSDCLTYGQVGAPSPQALTNLTNLSGDQLKTQFADDIYKDANSSDQPQNLGGLAIEDRIIEGHYGSDLFSAQTLIDDLENGGWTASIKDQSWNTNSAYSPTMPTVGSGATVLYGNGNGYIVSYTDKNQPAANMIVLSQASSGFTIEIKLDCGNILNPTVPSPNPYLSFNENSGVSKNPNGPFNSDVTVGKGVAAYFSNSVTYNGTLSSESYSWQVEGNYNSNGWGVTHSGGNISTSGQACGTTADNVGNSGANDYLPNNTETEPPNTTVPSGQNGQQGYCVYVFPTNDSKGTTYCQYIQVTDSNNKTDDDETALACATYDPSTPCVSNGCNCGNTCTNHNPPTPGSVSITATCTGITVNMPSTYYNNDPSGRYAIYESAVTSIPTWTAGVYPGTAPNDYPPIGDGALPNQPDASGTATYDENHNFIGYSSADDYGYSPSGVDNTDGTTQYMAPNAVGTYELSSSQIASGSITWYVVEFNAATVGGVPEIIVDSVAKTPQPLNCFTPVSCTLTLDQGQGVLGDPGNNNVESGQPFSYSLTINNNDPVNGLDDPINLDDGAFSLYANISYQGGGWDNDVGTDVPASSSRGITLNSQAPNDTSPHPMTAYIGYNGVSGSHMGDQPNNYLATCQVLINDYAQFNYTPTGSTQLLLSQPAGGPGQSNTQDPNTVEKTYSYSLAALNGDNLNGDTPVGVIANGGLYFVPAGQSPYDSSDRVEPDPGNQQQTPLYYIILPGTNLSGGDAYCLQENITPGSGFVGPGGSYLDPDGTPDSGFSNAPTASLNPPACSYITNEPYASFTGNDVIGNTSFGSSSCSEPSASGIYTFTNDNDTAGGYNYPSPTSAAAGTGGSSSQFGAEAVGIIEGLTSAGLRNSYPTGPTGLTFANGSDAGGGNGGNPMGGDFGYTSGDSSCEPDYYGSDMPLSNNLIPVNSTNEIDSDLSSNNTPPTVTATNPYNGYNYYSNGDLTIGSGGAPGSEDSIGIGNGVKDSIFVNGNVYINSNIVYPGSGSWSQPSDIPSFYIIAKGNIYINPNVTELDGVYIAQPSSTGDDTGVIDTCATGDGLLAVDNIFGDGTYQYLDSNGDAATGTLPGCDQQLTVNGAFVDQATVLDRSFSSLRDSEAGENSIPGTTYTPHPCGTPGQDINGTIYGAGSLFTDCAAEIFNFSPEVYLSQPSFQPVSGLNLGKYNFINSLSPVL